MLNFNDLRSKKMKEQMKQQQNALSSKKEFKVDERLYYPKLSKDVSPFNTTSGMLSTTPEP